MQMNVLLARVPHILRDILEHEITRHSDLHLLSSEPAPSVSLSRNEEPHAVVIANAVLGEPSVTTAWLTRFPRARVVVVAPADGTAELYELRRHRRVLGCMSPSELVAMLRRAP